MIRKHSNLTVRLESLLDLIDIPDSYYRLAIERYESLYRWFTRKESKIKDFFPYVYSQGSFRLGTVNRPLTDIEEYDLDIVCELRLTKMTVSQKRLKELIGEEVASYVKAHNFNEPASKKKRCWRIEYADKVSFHIDILPAIPEEESVIGLLVELNVDPKFAKLAIAITDNRATNYEMICNLWPRSNSNGYGKWFESRMLVIAQPRLKSLMENRAYAKADDIPTFEWKTPLQRAIQILKRHRDVMFHDRPELKPISMIITTLAAHAYDGEADLGEALTSILETMPQFIHGSFPRVGNPVNPLEDFAERWKEDSDLEFWFYTWHKQAQADFLSISHQSEKRAANIIIERFEVEYPTPDVISPGHEFRSAPAIVIPSTQVNIQQPARPWGA